MKINYAIIASVLWYKIVFYCFDIIAHERNNGLGNPWRFDVLRLELYPKLLEVQPFQRLLRHTFLNFRLDQNLPCFLHKLILVTNRSIFVLSNACIEALALAFTVLTELASLGHGDPTLAQPVVWVKGCLIRDWAG